MRWQILLAILALGATACADDEAPDAYGNIEATEVVVAAEVSGQIDWFSPEEGAPIAAGALAGVIDTTAAALEIEQINALQASVRSRANEVLQQVDVLSVQREIAQRTLARTRRLYGQQAATAPQLDQAERDFRVLGEQIEGARAQHQTVLREAAATQARVSQAREKIRNSRIVNPQAGTVLTTYARAGEFVQTGQPLYRVADLSIMLLRAYVSESQLGQIKLGQRAVVRVDVGAERRAFEGKVVWISSEAEFTPTPIETREERVGLVYAVKIEIANPSRVLKIGLPADVEFPSQPTAAR